MANWTNTSIAYLSGTITGSLVLDSANTGAGSIPSSWNTYDDGTYDDSTYTPTAVFNGQVDSTIGRPRLHITQSGDSGDIKYRFRTSPTGSSWGSWSSLTDSYGKEYFDADNRWIDLEVIFYSPLWTDSDYFGIQTVGAQFIRFQKNETIYAEEMNSNFNYLGGTRLPYGGLYLLPTTGVYNLGSDVYRWKKIYSNSISADSVSPKLWREISNVKISVASADIEISGLNGDLDIDYNMVVSICNTDTTASSYYLYINNDSSSSYGYQQTILSTTTYSITRGSSTGIYIGDFTGKTTGAEYIRCEITINAKSGVSRIVSMFSQNKFSVSKCSNVMLSSWIWNNTSTITSLKIIGNTSTSFGTGSSIVLWGGK